MIIRNQNAIRFLFSAWMFFQSSAFAETLNVALGAVPGPLDWNEYCSLNEAPIVVNTQTGLYHYVKNSFDPSPMLAEGVEKSDQNKTYRFKIRKTVKWSDGKPIYAQDFVNGWIRLLSPQTTSMYYSYLFDVVGAAEYHARKGTADQVAIKAIDDRTFEVKFKTPQPQFEKLTAFWPLFPVRKDLIEKFGANWSRAGTMVSSGPFILDSIEAGKKITLVRNPVFSPSARPEKIVFHLYEDSTQAMKQFESGFYRFLDFKALGKIAGIEKNPGFSTIPILRNYTLLFNSRKFPMNMKPLREAIYQIIKQTRFDLNPKFFPVAWGLVPPPLPGNIKAGSEAKHAAKNQAKAPELLSSKVKIKLFSLTHEPFATIASNIKDAIEKKLGIHVEIISAQGREYYALGALKDFDMTINAWTAKLPAPEDMLSTYSSDSPHTGYSFVDPTYDSLYKTARQASGAEKTKALIAAQKRLTEEMVYVVPLFFENGFLLKKKDLQGLFFDPMGIMHLEEVH